MLSVLQALLHLPMVANGVATHVGCSDLSEAGYLIKTDIDVIKALNLSAPTIKSKGRRMFRQRHRRVIPQLSPTDLMQNTPYPVRGVDVVASRSLNSLGSTFIFTDYGPESPV